MDCLPNRDLTAQLHEDIKSVAAAKSELNGSLHRYRRLNRSIIKRLLADVQAKHAAMMAMTVRVSELEAQAGALRDALHAEQECTLALNERLAEYEARDTSPPPEMLDPITIFLQNVRDENARARQKHPGTPTIGLALMEESGEVAQALMDEPFQNVYMECIQVASTAMRVALEGDRSVDMLRFMKGLNPLPGAMVKAPGDEPIIPSRPRHSLNLAGDNIPSNLSAKMVVNTEVASPRMRHHAARRIDD